MCTCMRMSMWACKYSVHAHVGTPLINTRWVQRYYTVPSLIPGVESAVSRRLAPAAVAAWPRLASRCAAQTVHQKVHHAISGQLDYPEHYHVLCLVDAEFIEDPVSMVRAGASVRRFGQVETADAHEVAIWILIFSNVLEGLSRVWRAVQPLAEHAIACILETEAFCFDVRHGTLWTSVEEECVSLSMMRPHRVCFVAACFDKRFERAIIFHLDDARDAKLFHARCRGRLACLEE